MEGYLYLYEDQKRSSIKVGRNTKVGSVTVLGFESA